MYFFKDNYEEALTMTESSNFVTIVYMLTPLATQISL